jgi:hypothetical protein
MCFILLTHWMQVLSQEHGGSGGAVQIGCKFSGAAQHEPSYHVSLWLT